MTIENNQTTTTTTYVGNSVSEHLELVQPPQIRKLDLACGQNCQPGFEGLDLPGARAHIQRELDKLRERALDTQAALQRSTAELQADSQRTAELTAALAAITYEHNLLRFPWPFETSSIDELHSSHFVEHIPMEFVDAEGNYVPCGTPGAKDLWFAFFDECYRILKPDAWMTVIAPSARNNRAFQDPTHRRFLVAESFLYLFADWRKANRLDHYNVICNFAGDVGSTIPVELSLRAPEVQQREFNHSWNIVQDWVVKLKTIKPAP